MEATSDVGVFVQLSGVLKRVAVKLSKTCNDLRLLSPGPRAGLNEINLPVRQAGSSIMPGKVNPVIPEVVNKVAFEVIGNDVTITLAAEGGQLQLNAFEPDHRAFPFREPCPPSGSFRPSLIDGLVSPGGELFSRRAGVLPNWLGCRRSAGGCVLVDVEQVGEMLLGGVHVGEHALYAGPSLAAVVIEQHGFLDAGEFVEQFAYRQV